MLRIQMLGHLERSMSKVRAFEGKLCKRRDDSSAEFYEGKRVLLRPKLGSWAPQGFGGCL